MGESDQRGTLAGGLRAVLAPHAGYRYSGSIAAHAYEVMAQYLQVSEQRGTPTLTRVIVLGPSHHVHLTNIAVSNAFQLETPLGALAVDRAAAESLVSSGSVRYTSQAEDENEHSIEMHLPFIAFVVQVLSRAMAKGAANAARAPSTSAVIPGVSVLPIMVGSLTLEREREFGALLAPLIRDERTLTVVSSDFCHFGQRFRYCPKPEPGLPLHRSIEALDRRGMALIESRDHGAFSSYLAETRNTICGRHPIGLLMAALDIIDGSTGDTGGANANAKAERAAGDGQPSAARGKHRIRFVAYAQSNQAADASDSSVSYAAAIVTREQY